MSHANMHTSSLHSLIGTIIKNKSYVSAYSTLVWLHLGVSIATGAFFMYNLFHRSGDTESDAISSCESKNGDDDDTCKKAFELARGIIVALLVVFWLLELCKSRASSVSVRMRC